MEQIEAINTVALCILALQIKTTKGTHNADSIIESKVIYYLEQCGLGV